MSPDDPEVLFQYGRFIHMHGSPDDVHEVRYIVMNGCYRKYYYFYTTFISLSGVLLLLILLLLIIIILLSSVLILDLFL